MICANTKFFQAAWVVNDLEQAMQRWIKTAAVGPFYVSRHVELEDYRYRGEPTKLDVSTALAQAGAMQIELIEQHSEGPSAYRDTYPEGCEGFHHICAFVDDFGKEVERHGPQSLPFAAEGVFGDMRFGYIDTRQAIGCMTEIIEDRKSIREVFKLVADAAVNWDGRDPIRTF